MDHKIKRIFENNSQILWTNVYVTELAKGRIASDACGTADRALERFNARFDPGR